MSSRPFRSISAGSTFVGALLIIGLCRVVSGANPNSREPMNPMDVHNLTNAQPTLATASGLFASTLKDVQAIGGNPTRVAGKKLSDLFAQIRQLRRAALDLQMLGETAGVDYSLRAGVVGGQLGKIISGLQSRRSRDKHTPIRPGNTCSAKKPRRRGGRWPRICRSCCKRRNWMRRTRS